MEKDKSISEIKGLPEVKSEFGSSLEKNILKAEQKPIKELTNEDLRILLGQNLHLELIVPIVLDRLKFDILTRSEDLDVMLLTKLLQIESNYWEDNPEIKNTFDSLIKNNRQNIEEPQNKDKIDLDVYRQQELPELRKLIDNFIRI